MTYPNTKRWSQFKLEKEICFAESCDDGGAHSLEWNKILLAEVERRGMTNNTLRLTETAS